MINYTPFGHADWQTIVADIKKFGSAGKKTAVVSTINGDANVPFYKELGNQGVKATDIPVVAFSVGEEELAGLDTTPLVGHLAAWNYFMSVDTPENEEFIEKWKAFIKNDKRVTNDPMEAHVIGFNMWVKAVEKAGTTDPDAVIDAIVGVSVPNLTGGYSTMMPNHHITKPVLIGEIQDDGQFDDGVGDAGPRRRRRVVGLSGRLEGPDLRLARSRCRAATSTSRPASAAARARRIASTCPAERLHRGGGPRPPPAERADQQTSTMLLAGPAARWRRCSRPRARAQDLDAALAQLSASGKFRRDREGRSSSWSASGHADAPPASSRRWPTAGCCPRQRQGGVHRSRRTGRSRCQTGAAADARRAAAEGRAGQQPPAPHHRGRAGRPHPAEPRSGQRLDAAAGGVPLARPAALPTRSTRRWPRSGPAGRAAPSTEARAAVLVGKADAPEAERLRRGRGPGRARRSGSRGDPALAPRRHAAGAARRPPARPWPDIERRLAHAGRRRRTSPRASASARCCCWPPSASPSPSA